MKIKSITYGSICSGIEAATLAWERLGFQAAWFSEIEPFPSAVLAQRWPNIFNHGDMTQLAAKILSGSVVAPDVLVGGTPCQAFSVAGSRRSLQDKRSNLTLMLVELLNAIDLIRIRAGKQPCLLVWENVPGILNTKDNAFGCFLGALAGEDLPLISAGKRWTNAGCVLGHQRRITWRVLDAQYFGIPQRRRRVYLVASAGLHDPTEILFERNSMCGNIGTGTEAQASTAAYIECGFGGYRELHIGGTVRASGGSASGGSESLIVVAGNIIGRSHYTGGNGKGFNASGLCYTLTASDRHAVADGISVRRLTPLECERLQGMPDNHTLIAWRGKPASQCPDSPRYKAIGNSMCVPVMHWIGQRIYSKYFKAINK